MQVVGANIVKSGSRTFAVYSISVTDVNNYNSWSIKRRFLIQTLWVYLLMPYWFLTFCMHLPFLFL